MPAVDFDRQAIERRDFPIGRRGYDPAEVDAHLRALAAEFEELQRKVISGGGDVSIATSAGTQVQTILEAAESTASDIEAQALEAARQTRDAAERDADRTRAEAVEKAQAHVAAVEQATAALLERVGGMDGEIRTLIDSMRAGATRLAGDLAAVEGNMGDLYDAAAGRGEFAGQFETEPEPPAEATPSAFDSELAGAMAEPEPEFQAAALEPAPESMPAPGGEGDDDLDGARLIALNMALNGESRADTERYLAENFQLPDRLKLIDEVYAAIEG
jgi:DivIVA domain-containing protein